MNKIRLSLLSVIISLILEVLANDKNDKRENSLVVQWLGLGAFTNVAQVQSLVRERRSQKLCGVAKRKKKIKDITGELLATCQPSPQ